jgi:hypothetical protein
VRILPENQVSLARSTPNPLDKVHLISASVEVGKTLSGLSVGGEGISATVQSFSIIGSENGREDGARALFDWKPMEPTTCMASPSQTAELQVEDWLSVRPSRENARLESERSHRGENRLLVRTSQLQSEWSLVSSAALTDTFMSACATSTPDGPKWQDVAHTGSLSTSGFRAGRERCGRHRRLQGRGVRSGSATSLSPAVTRHRCAGRCSTSPAASAKASLDYEVAGQEAGQAGRRCSCQQNGAHRLGDHGQGRILSSARACCSCLKGA